MKPEEVAVLLHPFVKHIAIPEPQWSHLCGQLTVYLDLIVKWNSRTNLTAIRKPEDIVRRHFGESLFAASYVGNCATLLDFGSGAGFPGVPVQLLRPDIHVTLAESQGKKAAFLREVCRELSISAEVFPSRVETMPTNRKFEVITLRAVDNMDNAFQEATRRATQRILLLATLNSKLLSPPKSAFRTEQISIPTSDTSTVAIFTRQPPR